ncbi:MAG: DegT/DnrJ/EryC1/StrS family aminotransferase [Deltaproteobacteria bacterium]|nr:MAG: DegT/DnrJ/EryC1/StrS family aminotransferase [Deltaproteobacteria bacterium]
MIPAIRMADLQGLYRGSSELIEREVIEVLRSGRWVGGDRVAQAERLAADRFHRSHAIGVNSGTDALMIALQVAGVRPGGEVIVPALSFFATAGAVCAIGAIPVIVDVDERGLLDLGAATRAMSPSVQAIVPVHLFGAQAPHPDLGVPVVDDLAQAIGGRPGQGLLGASSTYPTKTWGSAGDGGFIVTDDPTLAAKARALANHGLAGAHLHHAVDGIVGRNSRLDAVQAAVLVAMAPRLDERLARRRAHATRYDRGLPQWVRPLPREPEHPVHHYVVRVSERDRCIQILARHGIETAIYYPRPLHAQPALQGRARLTPCPLAETLCQELLALPVHAGLSEPQIDHVCRVFRSEVR